MDQQTTQQNNGQETVQDVAQQVLDQNSGQQQFAVSQTPFHTHNGADSQRLNFSNLVGVVRFILYRVSDADSPLVVTAGIGGSVVMPFKGFVTGVGATVDTAGTTGTMTVDVNKNGTSILSGKITIATGETDSRDYPTQPVIVTQPFVVGDIFTFDLDTIQTTPAKGLTIFLNLST